jgi:nitroreductase
MDVVDAIHSRHSVRFFTSEALSREDIVALMSAAAAAPSSFNSQPWHFHVATGATRDRVTEAMAVSTRHLYEYIEVLGEDAVQEAERFYANLGDAPVVVAVTVPQVSGETDQMNEYIAAGCAIENILLTATERELGACNITLPDWVVADVRAILGIPEGVVLISLIVLGHPAEAAHPPQHNTDVYTVLD